MVSICCIAFNQENYIAEALDSFLIQKTNFDFEILIHDDASTDRTAEIIKTYENKYPGIIKPIYQTQNQYSMGTKVGYTYNFSRAKGKYIALCEGDDYWIAPNKLQKQVDYMENHPECSLCVHAAKKIFGDKRVGYIKPGNKNKLYTADEVILGGGGMFATNSMLFQTLLVKSMPDFFINCPVGDYPLAIYLSLKGKVFYMKDSMAVYRVMAKNSWSSTMEGDLQKNIIHIGLIEQMLNQVDQYSDYTHTNAIKKHISENQFHIMLQQGKFKEVKNKTIKGLFWSFSDLIANQGIQFIIQVILARHLVPKDFGIIGMIMVFIAISQSFIDSGFTSALIREKKPSQEDYSTVFYFNLCMAVLMYIVLFFAAGAISNFFKEPQLVAILRVLAIVIIINAFGLIQGTMLTKNINFKTQTKISVISSILSGIIAIIFAYLGYGVWSLVIRAIAIQFIQALLLCIYNRWIPSLVFKLDSFKKLFGFGWKLLVSGLIDSLYNNLYFLIIGKIFSTVELGYYTNAQKLRDTASQSITTSVQKVSYPVLSSINEDEDKDTLREAYRKIIKTAVFITFPMMFGLAVVASPLVRLIFGQKWIASIPYFQILCFAGMLFPLHAINLNILKVKGRSDLFLGLEIVKKIIGLLSIAIVLFFKLGIIGLLWAAVLISYIAYFINSYYSSELLSYSTREQIKDIAPAFIAAVLMAIVVYLSGAILPDNNLVKLIIQIIIGVLVYAGACKIGKIKEMKTVFELLSTIFKKGKGAAAI